MGRSTLPSLAAGDICVYHGGDMCIPRWYVYIGDMCKPRRYVYSTDDIAALMQLTGGK